MCYNNSKCHHIHTQSLSLGNKSIASLDDISADMYSPLINSGYDDFHDEFSQPNTVCNRVWQDKKITEVAYCL